MLHAVQCATLARSSADTRFAVYARGGGPNAYRGATPRRRRTCWQANQGALCVIDAATLKPELTIDGTVTADRSNAGSGRCNNGCFLATWSSDAVGHASRTTRSALMPSGKRVVIERTFGLVSLVSALTVELQGSALGHGADRQGPTTGTIAIARNGENDIAYNSRSFVGVQTS